jgi:transposase, IS30 family
MKGDLTKVERLEIAILIEKGYSMRAIARVLGRSPNTISYEVMKNSVRGVYNPHKAHLKAQVRKKSRKFQYSKIEKEPRLKGMIIGKLQEHWNPREIAGWIQKHHPEYTVSTNTIYTWLRTSRGDRYCDLLYSERHYPKKHTNKTKRVLIPDRIGIEERPREVLNRSVYGHYESDTIVSCRGGTGAILVLQERQGRRIYLWKLSGMKPAPCARHLKDAHTSLHIQSITFDNGIENIHHASIGVPTYFCDPYSSWQKGSVENVNKMIRRYVPKGTNLATISQEFLDWIADRINKKPRVILGYKSAYEADAEGRASIKRLECPN